MDTAKSEKKRGRPKGSKKSFHITYEILPPGTLKRNSPSSPDTPAERWEEIIEICSEVIAESQ